MGKSRTPGSNLCAGEQRALNAFLAGRLPAGQLHGALCRARAEAIAAAQRDVPEQAPALTPALHAA